MNKGRDEMNEGHLRYLASPEWAETLRRDLLPWLTRVVDLGDDVLEIGPGPGLTTDLLRERVLTVTAVELDASLAAALAERLAGTGTRVLHADATATDLPANRFSTVTAFSMLHHMPSPDHQDRLFAEVCRMLRPGGTFVGVDGKDVPRIRDAHVGDVFVPVDPDRLAARLVAAGLSNATIEDGEIQFRFTARKDAQ
ncbi:Dimethyladenosine transferase (RRNA methylation) [Frankia canadensis]|uniref:Dimethyladenosine transferase (RRNA methylation) n=2 Tax=Frankia canadensis TaxID=1836972 RepID=A0A2I2KNR4_9ACTN|nr:Dimethyladenosine transferase (RRNA methylation) [Frankia canadensis]SOU54607.1 Dimethyladenosine transferase (RRNA methylation) [Frankia canadensis]